MLKVNNISGGYGKNIILHDISFNVKPGEVLGILGPNGSGKSTLLKILLRFIPKTNGIITYNSIDINKINRFKLAQTFAYIPQKDTMLFPYTVFEMVLMGRTNHIGPLNTPSKQDEDIVYETLHKLKISHLENKPYPKISGGEKQLVLIARALCQETSILIMDEPTSSLDYANQKLIMDAIKTASLENKSVIFTTHSPTDPFLIASNVLLLKSGKTIGFGKPLDILTSDNLEYVYGIPMDILSFQDRNQNERNICLPIY